MKKNTTFNKTRGSISLIGTPVSMFNCANAPFPVMISPISENTNPSCANLPTNSSFAFVNPNNGPAQTQSRHEFDLSRFNWKEQWHRLYCTVNLPPSLRPIADRKLLPGGMTARSSPVAGSGSSMNFPRSPRAPMAPRRVNKMKNRRRGSAS